eukprot:scaffold27086_cov17-Tisochrysis_lutea.AAC.1
MSRSTTLVASRNITVFCSKKAAQKIQEWIILFAPGIPESLQFVLWFLRAQCLVSVLGCAWCGRLSEHVELSRAADHLRRQHPPRNRAGLKPGR